MNLEKFMIAMIVFAVVFSAGIYMVSDVSTNYNLTNDQDSDFQAIYDELDEIYDIEEGMRNETQESISQQDTSDNIVLIAFSAIRRVWDTFDIIGDIIQLVATKLKIPQFFVTFAILGLSLGVIWGLIFLFTRVGK